MVREPSEIVQDLWELVGRLRQRSPYAKIFLAQIIPTSGACPSVNQLNSLDDWVRARTGPDDAAFTHFSTRIPTLNAAIAQSFAEASTSESPLVVVDHSTGFDAASLTWDGIHPNAGGDQEMAERWLRSLQQHALGTKFDL